MTWRLSERELAERIRLRAIEGKTVTLTPETAIRVAHALRVLAVKPTQADILRQLCRWRCVRHCSPCLKTAAAILALMEGDDPGPPTKPVAAVYPLTERQRKRIVRMLRG